MDTSMDLTTGWTKHPLIPGGYYLVYSDEWIQEISIVTGPRGSGLMASNNPGYETTYEVRFPALDDPTGHLTLEEVKGIIKFLRQQAQEAQRYS